MNASHLKSFSILSFRQHNTWWANRRADKSGLEKWTHAICHHMVC